MSTLEVSPYETQSRPPSAVVNDFSIQVATVNGSGPFYYRIEVRDLGEPGVGTDTYWILLETGYNSGDQTLRGCNVQIRRN